MKYREFFEATTGRSPLPYQVAFQTRHDSYTILLVPTGLGKTDTVLIDWLYRRLNEPATTPRRLIWCLPGRALTEQVTKVARERVSHSGVPVRVYQLMGGSGDNDITLGPDESAIIVGTQDLLLSRALNRGYARAPFRWPIDFALLNNDCYWVLDEVQLLGDALATSTQLAAFHDALGCFGYSTCCWISATFDPAWLSTFDFERLVPSLRLITLGADDREHAVVRKRIHAPKKLERALDLCRLPAGVAQFVAGRHQPNTLSLVVANTVPRAREIWTALERLTKAELVLLHSRFRAADRAEHTAQLTSEIPPQGRIVVATQVIEAGLDLTASLMVTDIAPYANLVQRFGRVNRYGDDADAQIFWVDRPLTAKRKAWADVPTLKSKEKDEISAPYLAADLDGALGMIRALPSAAPADLPKVTARAPWEHVLRRADILDLFDTTPDLAGNQIDISRFVRTDANRDVYVAWRDWTGTQPPSNLPGIGDNELCLVPVGDMEKFAAKHAVWYWDTLNGCWILTDDPHPGWTILVHVSEGGYTRQSGWSPESTSRVPLLEHRASPNECEAFNDDRRSFLAYRQTLLDHTEWVCSEMQALLAALSGIGLESYHSDLQAAARKHDWGKAHEIMQRTLHNAPPPYEEFLAKQERGKADPHGHSRRYFRHELASALAMLQEGDNDLAAYLAATHHGRIRLSIRSMPGERDDGRSLARGIEDGDSLPPCQLCDGALRPQVTLSLAPMQLGLANGLPTWTDRMLSLRDTLGPFRLAYLEMLLRIADQRASEKAGEEIQ
jgi:CRISPR-associated endonuclease/helicase Cas3